MQLFLKNRSVAILTLIIFMFIESVYFSNVQAVTDAELEALEKQLQQHEAAVKNEAEERRKLEQEKQRQIELEQKRKEEERKSRLIEEQKKSEVEKQKIIEEERKRLEEEQRLKAEKEKKDIYDNHIRLAESYMVNDDFDNALKEFQSAMNVFPDDSRALKGIEESQKYINACKNIVGKWFLEPNGITWQVHEDKTVYGTWLIFSSNGFWECVDARKREVVVSWPDCGVCLTEYLYLSEDGKTMKSSRGTATHGRKIDELDNETQKREQSPPVKL